MAKTIKELAKEMNCSYEAVRKQVKRYGKDLKDHIYMQHKTQYLDEYACDFIRDKRMDSPVVLSRIEHDEAVEILKTKYIELLEAHTKLQAENLVLRESADQVALLEADNEAQRAKTLAAEKTAQEAQEAAEAVRKSAEDEKKILEGFIRDAKKELEAVQEEAKIELAEKDKRIQELENRSRWQRFLDVFK